MERAPDYVIMDVPYFGLCRDQYSARPDDIANMDEAGWTAAMGRIAEVCADAGVRRCTIMVAKFVDNDRRRRVLCPEIVRDAWRAVGYDWRTSATPRSAFRRAGAIACRC